jgi:hypothetical protein
VEALIGRAGGFWQALLSAVPGLRDAARVVRPSTSSGISRTDKGTAFPDSRGVHVFLSVRDGSDIPRFTKDLHARCRLAGFGWGVIDEAGRFHPRSIVDSLVGSPERPVFEGAPIVDFPLEQDAEARRPIVCEGEMIDTLAVCPPLSPEEIERAEELDRAEKERLAPETARAKEAHVDRHTRLGIERGMSPEKAAWVARRLTEGELPPDFVLPFDDRKLAGTTAARVLKEPRKFADETLADPNGGGGGRRNVAVVKLREDGVPWIFSFAHGGTHYELGVETKDFAAIERDDLRLKQLEEKWIALGFDGKGIGDYPDRGKAVFAFCCECVRVGVRDDAFQSCLLHWKIGEHLRQLKVGYTRAVARVLYRAHEQERNRSCSR